MTKAAGFSNMKRVTKVPGQKFGGTLGKYHGYIKAPSSTSGAGSVGKGLKPHKVNPSVALPEPKGMGGKKFMPRNW